MLGKIWPSQLHNKHARLGSNPSLKVLKIEMHAYERSRERWTCNICNCVRIYCWIFPTRQIFSPIFASNIWDAANVPSPSLPTFLLRWQTCHTNISVNSGCRVTKSLEQQLLAKAFWKAKISGMENKLKHFSYWFYENMTIFILIPVRLCSGLVVSCRAVARAFIGGGGGDGGVYSYIRVLPD